MKEKVKVLIQEKLKDILLKDLSPNKIRTIVSDFHLKSY